MAIINKLFVVEEAFRNLKGELAIRPISPKGEKQFVIDIVIAFEAYYSPDPRRRRRGTTNSC
jgi:hypothetical protein